MILNEDGEHIIQHHVKYKEIHGYDKIVLMTRSDHSKLHRRLRKTAKCKIPVEELTRISNRARMRSPIGKEQAKEYYKEYYKKNKKEVIKKTDEYREKNLDNINSKRRERYAQRKKEGSLKNRADYHKEWWKRKKIEK